MTSAFSAFPKMDDVPGFSAGMDAHSRAAFPPAGKPDLQNFPSKKKVGTAPREENPGRASWRLSRQAARYARFEERFARIADSVPFGIWVFGADGRIKSLSASFLNLLSLSFQECSRIVWTDLVHPDDRDRVKSLWQECTASRRSWDGEFRVVAADGTIHFLLSRGGPLADLDDSSLEYGGIHLDITDRVLHQEEMARLQGDLEKRVTRQTGALRELSRRLMSFQDEERRRIARELHDSTGQSLTAIKMSLDILGRDARNFSADSRKVFEELLSLVDSCSAGVRTISHLLHPPLLDEVGLIPAVRWYVEGFVERSGIQVEMHLQEIAVPLPWELSTALFRILQEALTNILKHSAAQTVRISLTECNGRIILEVRDSGRGFDPDLLEDRNHGIHGLGVGITGMRERVAQLDGQLSIQNADPGALVRASFPISKLQVEVKDGTTASTDR